MIMDCSIAHGVWVTFISYGVISLNSFSNAETVSYYFYYFIVCDTGYRTTFVESRNDVNVEPIRLGSQT